MKTIALFASLLVCLTACHTGTNKDLKQLTVDADSVAINYFKGDGTFDTVVTVKIIRDKNDINKLSDLISATSTDPEVKCGYDGSVHFFKQDSVVADIYFRMNDEHCMLFSFLQDGKLNATVLSPDAKEFLEMIKK
ncbi:MAG TPA: hypothetical protein VK705_10890 [Ferruginibacter sp.]|jgi:hypothetical protein|nr:hypothetical protein [Ferruginibacter sp.]